MFCYCDVPDSSNLASAQSTLAIHTSPRLSFRHESIRSIGPYPPWPLRHYDGTVKRFRSARVELRLRHLLPSSLVQQRLGRRARMHPRFLFARRLLCSARVPLFFSRTKRKGGTTICF